MYKIGIVGDKDSILGFMALGFAVRACDGKDDALRHIRKLAAEEYAVIFVTEDIMEKFAETNELERYKTQPVPAIIAIPPKSGSTGYGMTNIKRSIERAVGADILFD